MKKGGKKNKKNYSLGRILLNKTISVVLLVLLFLVLVAYSREVIRAHNINREIKAMEEEIARIESANSSIFDNIQYYKTLAFLESEARAKMGRSKDGEKLIIISDEEENIEEFDNSYTEEETLGSDFNPLNWFNYFFGSRE